MKKLWYWLKGFKSAMHLASIFVLGCTIFTLARALEDGRDSIKEFLSL